MLSSIQAKGAMASQKTVYSSIDKQRRQDLLAVYYLSQPLLAEYDRIAQLLTDDERQRASKELARRARRHGSTISYSDPLLSSRYDPVENERMPMDTQNMQRSRQIQCRSSRASVAQPFSSQNKTYVGSSRSSSSRLFPKRNDANCDIQSNDHTQDKDKENTDLGQPTICLASLPTVNEIIPKMIIAQSSAYHKSKDNWPYSESSNDNSVCSDVSQDHGDTDLDSDFDNDSHDYQQSLRQSKRVVQPRSKLLNGESDIFMNNRDVSPKGNEANFLNPGSAPSGAPFGLHVPMENQNIFTTTSLAPTQSSSSPAAHSSMKRASSLTNLAEKDKPTQHTFVKVHPYESETVKISNRRQVPDSHQLAQQTIPSHSSAHFTGARRNQVSTSSPNSAPSSPVISDELRFHHSENNESFSGHQSMISLPNVSEVQANIGSNSAANANTLNDARPRLPSKPVYGHYDVVPPRFFVAQKAKEQITETDARVAILRRHHIFEHLLNLEFERRDTLNLIMARRERIIERIIMMLKEISTRMVRTHRSTRWVECNIEALQKHIKRSESTIAGYVRSLYNVDSTRRALENEVEYRWSTPNHFYLAAFEHFSGRFPRRNLLEIASAFSGHLRICALANAQAMSLRRITTIASHGVGVIDLHKKQLQNLFTELAIVKSENERLKVLKQGVVSKFSHVLQPNAPNQDPSLQSSNASSMHSETEALELKNSSTENTKPESSISTESDNTLTLASIARIPCQSSNDTRSQGKKSNLTSSYSVDETCNRDSETLMGVYPHLQRSSSSDSVLSTASASGSLCSPIILAAANSMLSQTDITTFQPQTPIAAYPHSVSDTSSAGCMGDCDGECQGHCTFPCDCECDINCDAGCFGCDQNDITCFSDDDDEGLEYRISHYCRYKQNRLKMLSSSNHSVSVDSELDSPYNSIRGNSGTKPSSNSLSRTGSGDIRMKYLATLQMGSTRVPALSQYTDEVLGIPSSRSADENTSESTMKQDSKVEPPPQIGDLNQSQNENKRVLLHSSSHEESMARIRQFDQVIANELCRGQYTAPSRFADNKYSFDISDSDSGVQTDGTFTKDTIGYHRKNQKKQDNRTTNDISETSAQFVPVCEKFSFSKMDLHFSKATFGLRPVSREVLSLLSPMFNGLDVNRPPHLYSHSQSGEITVLRTGPIESSTPVETLDLAEKLDVKTDVRPNQVVVKRTLQNNAISGTKPFFLVPPTPPSGIAHVLTPPPQANTAAHEHNVNEFDSDLFAVDGEAHPRPRLRSHSVSQESDNGNLGSCFLLKHNPVSTEEDIVVSTHSSPTSASQVVSVSFHEEFPDPEKSLSDSSLSNESNSSSRSSTSLPSINVPTTPTSVSSSSDLTPMTSPAKAGSLCSICAVSTASNTSLIRSPSGNKTAVASVDPTHPALVDFCIGCSEKAGPDDQHVSSSHLPNHLSTHLLRDGSPGVLPKSKSSHHLSYSFKTDESLPTSSKDAGDHKTADNRRIPPSSPINYVCIAPESVSPSLSRVSSTDSNGSVSETTSHTSEGRLQTRKKSILTCTTDTQGLPSTQMSLHFQTSQHGKTTQPIPIPISPGSSVSSISSMPISHGSSPVISPANSPIASSPTSRQALLRSKASNPPLKRVLSRTLLGLSSDLPVDAETDSSKTNMEKIAKENGGTTTRSLKQKAQEPTVAVHVQENLEHAPTISKNDVSLNTSFKFAPHPNVPVTTPSTRSQTSLSRASSEVSAITSVSEHVPLVLPPIEWSSIEALKHEVMSCDSLYEKAWAELEKVLSLRENLKDAFSKVSDFSIKQ